MTLTNLRIIEEIRGMGDNSKNLKSNDNKLTTDETKKRLLSFFDRVERLEAEKAALSEDIKEIYAEAKSAGFEVKIMRRIMKLRKMDIEKRSEEAELLSLYMAAIGMQ